MSTSNQQSLRTKGFMLAIIGALLMSLDPVFIRFAGVSGFDTSFLFGLFTAISMPLVLKKNDPRGIKQAVIQSGWPLLATGILMLGSASALVFSIKLTTIANTFVIISATPAIAALLSWVVLKESTKLSTWVAIIFVMIGIVIVMSGSFGSGNWIGDVLAFISVLCLSIMLTVLRKYPDTSRLASVAFGGLLLAVVMFFFASPSTYSLNTWLIMGVMGLFSAPIGRVLSMVATRYISAAEVSMTMMLETVIAIIWAYLFFNEIPEHLSLIGGGIILFTILVYTMIETKK